MTAPQGAWARHIHAVRKERGWSQTRGFEIARENGLPLGERSRSAYIAIDMGYRPPTEAELPALIATYGPLPEGQPDVEETPAADPGLASEIRLLREAIEAQTKMLAGHLDAQTGALSGFADGVQGLLTRLVAEHVNTEDGREQQPAGTQ